MTTIFLTYKTIQIFFIFLIIIRISFQGLEQQPDHSLATQRLQQPHPPRHPHRQLQQAPMHSRESLCR